MEIYQRYIAKDGRMFDDALECQEHEKTLGIIPGSVGELVKTMEKVLKRDQYIFAIVKVRGGDVNSVYIRATMSVDDMLEDYVNVENLTEQQRYKAATVGELIDTLKKVDKDLPCQFFIVFSDNIELGNAGCMASNNQNVWDKEQSEQFKL